MTRGRAIKLAAWLIRERVDSVRFNAEKDLSDSIIELMATAGVEVDTGGVVEQ